MPTTRYEIYVKGILSFVKFTKQDFEKVCSDLEKLNLKYKVQQISLI